MRKEFRVLLVLLTVGLGLGPIFAQSQEGAKESNPGPPKVAHVEPYRLDFSFNEISDGKVVNTRHYSMNLTAGNSDEIKIGTRVPVATAHSTPSVPAPMEYQYLDVGTNIWAQLREVGDELMLVVRGEVSNLDIETGDRSRSRSGATDDWAGAPPPVVRQIKIDGSTLLVLGKPLMIGSMDDPNSKRQFQLEVTVTKLR
jgi:hypothetical protein